MRSDGKARAPLCWRLSLFLFDHWPPRIHLSASSHGAPGRPFRSPRLGTDGNRQDGRCFSSALSLFLLAETRMHVCRAAMQPHPSQPEVARRQNDDYRTHQGEVVKRLGAAPAKRESYKHEGTRTLRRGVCESASKFKKKKKLRQLTLSQGKPTHPQDVGGGHSHGARRTTGGGGGGVGGRPPPRQQRVDVEVGGQGDARLLPLYKAWRLRGDGGRKWSQCCLAVAHTPRVRGVFESYAEAKAEGDTEKNSAKKATT